MLLLAVLLTVLALPVISAEGSEGMPAEAERLVEMLDDGYRFIESGSLEQAKTAFLAAARDWPRSIEAHQALGAVCYRLNCYDEAAAAFEEVILLSPDNAQAHSRLGFVYSQLNLPLKALGIQVKAISLQPDLAPAHWGLGLAYKQLGFLEEASREFREVIRLRPDFAEAHYDLAEACLIMKNNCEAIEVYNLLKELDRELADKLFDRLFRQ